MAYCKAAPEKIVWNVQSFVQRYSPEKQVMLFKSEGYKSHRSIGHVETDLLNLLNGQGLEVMFLSHIKNCPITQSNIKVVDLKD